MLCLNFVTFLGVDCRQVSSNDYSSLDTLTKNIVKEKQPFVRLEISKEDLLEMFKVSFKVHFGNRLLLFSKFSAPTIAFLAF